MTSKYDNLLIQNLDAAEINYKIHTSNNFIDKLSISFSNIIYVSTLNIITEYLFYATNLRILRFSNINILKNYFISVTHALKYSQLQELWLNEFTIELSMINAILELLRMSNTIHTLKISCNTGSELILILVREISFFAVNLKELDISNNDICLAAMSEIIELFYTYCKFETLCLGRGNNIDIRDITKLLMTSNELHTLDLSAARIDWCGINDFMSVLKTNKYLTTLILHRVDLDRLHVMDIVHALSQNETLKILDISANGIDMNTTDLIVEILNDNYCLIDIRISLFAPCIKLQQLIDRNKKNHREKRFNKVKAVNY